MINLHYPKKWPIIGTSVLTVVVAISLAIIYKIKIPNFPFLHPRTLIEKTEPKFLKEQAGKAKSVHIQITFSGVKDNERLIEADLQLPDKSQGTYQVSESDKKTIQQFIIIGDALYLKTPEDKKFVRKSKIDYTEISLYTPSELIKDTAEVTPIWKQTILDNKTVLETQISLITYFQNPLVVYQYPSQIYLFNNNSLPYKIIIKVQVSDDQTLTKTITYSDYNKKVDIQPPNDEEIAK